MARLNETVFTTCLVAASLLFAAEAYAQSHFSDCVSLTGSDATLVIPATAGPVVNDRPLAVGDEVAVFTTEGVCAGAGVWSGSDLVVTVWGDDTATEAKDGFEADEALLLRAWDSSLASEANDVDAALSGLKPYYRTRNTYETNAIYVLASFAASSEGPSAPPSPLLVAPANGAGDLQLDPTLVWRAAAGADDYRVQVAADPFFASILVDQGGVTDTTFQLSGLTQSSSYTWRIRAENDAGPGPYSSSRTFTTVYTGDFNTPPSFYTKPPVKTKADRAYVYDVLAIDADGDAVTVSAVTVPAWLSFSADGPTGALTGTPLDEDVGDHAVRIRATDALGAHTEQSFTVTVSAAAGNSAPRAVGRVPRQEAFVGDAVVAINLASVFEDDDGDTLQYGVETDVSGIVELAVDDSDLLITPVAPGAVIINVYARDPLGEVANTSFEMNVMMPSARERETPLGFTLDQNYPNPFNPRTTIAFSIDRPGSVRLELFDSLGQCVAILANGEHGAGSHTVELDATGLPTGVYHYRMLFGAQTMTRSLVLLR